MAIDELLSTRRDAIVRRFVADVQAQGVPPATTSRTNVVDHIPAFIDDLVRALRETSPVGEAEDVTAVSESARQHGIQRWEQGFDLDALVREYGVLRHCILAEAKEAGATFSIDEFDKLAMRLNVGVAEAVTAYTAERAAERTLQHERIEFLAEAGKLLASSLDLQATLSRVARMVIPRLADWCVIHLDGASGSEMLVAHVDPTKAELVRDLYTKVPWPVSSPAGYPRVIATGATELVPDARTAEAAWRVPEASRHAIFDGLGTRSWLIVPLRVQRATFGAITLAYAESGRHHGPDDVLLAEDLASRAAIAIENARLFDLANGERARVEAATRAKDEFVAMISHELRTPLNAILGWTRMIRHGGLPVEKHAHALEVIERNAEAQSHLIGDLLDVSRVISGSVSIDPAPMNLADAVEMAIEGVRPSAEAKRVVIDADVERANAALSGDAGRLLQVASNLLANAVKFTPTGGRVHVSLRRVASELELVVEDNGIGIASEFLPHMFESFRQSDPGAARAHGGLGIGLAIAKHLVALHHGTLSGSSAGVGLGAKFVMRVPVSSVVTSIGSARRATAVAAESGPGLPHGLDGVRVLVVDDEEDARELLQVVLETRGVVVRLAPNAAAAMLELEPFRPDVIVSDIGMANEDGYAFIQKVRTSASEQTRKIPAIALTAYAMAEDRNRALLAGFNLHLTKPADPRALLTMIADLAGRHATDEPASA